MTFPLMSSAFMRTSTRSDGEVLGGLYFVNSLGAAGGALISTFALMPAIGLPGTVAVAGVLNLVVAAVAMVALGAVSGRPEPAATSSPVESDAPGADVVRLRPLLVAAFVTGATSFVYEIVWVRMLNQVLGTTVHSFELMLTAFILGLALGGLWVRQRRGRLDRPLRMAADAQVLMGLAALGSTLVFAHAFDGAAWFMGSLARSPGGYTLYTVGSAVIAMAVMLPAAFFAGMTLPLFTVALLRARGAEADIGRVYASNTLGAIVGVFAAVHVLVPLLGLHLSIVLAAVADVVLGIVLYRAYVRPLPRLRYGGTLAAGAAVVVVAMLFGRPADEQLASGVFRKGSARISSEEKVEYLRDGKTSTVAVYSRSGEYGVISTNGKPDASLAVVTTVPPSPDESTMIMAGLMPLLLHPEPKQIAIIGWGSGLTTHTLLGSDVPESIDNIEIEPAMIVGAPLFGPRVERAYADPRSHIRIEDARTYFSSVQRKYDVIISEPSNPWVSGVASLFTREFYAQLRRHLAEGGMLVQWIHTYEIDDGLVGTMVAALLEEFPHVRAYITNGVDVLLVASDREYARLDWSRVDASPALDWELGRVGLSAPADIDVRFAGTRRELAVLAAATGEPPHSDYYPSVSLRGPRARFVGRDSTMIQNLVGGPLPLFDTLAPGARRYELAQVDAVSQSLATNPVIAGALFAESMRAGEIAPTLFVRDYFRTQSLAVALRLSAGPVQEDEFRAWTAAVAELAIATIGPLGARVADVWQSPRWIELEAQPPEVAAVMAALAAIAAGSPDASALAERALAHEPESQIGRAAPAMRAFLAAGAVLSATSRGEHALAVALTGRHDADLRADPRFDTTRVFLGEWLRRDAAAAR
jgi:spermidine synthase